MPNQDQKSIMDQIDSKMIHELENLASLTGREEFLIDDGIVTYRISVDGLLGYFASRFVGNDDDSIDISTLNAASCIHIIRSGQSIPYEERIQGHYYLTLSEQNIENLYDAIFEDNEGTRYYVKTGRNNISGLIFPDHYYINDSFHKFLKVFTLDITDETNNVYVNETFDIHLVNKVADGSVYSKFNKVHFEALFVNGTINNDSIIITCTDLSNNESLDKKVAQVYCTKDDDGVISLWLNMENINTVLINRTFSLSSDKAPDNMSSIVSGYIANFIDNNTADINTDVSNLKDTIGEIVKENIDSHYILLKRVEAIETAIVKADLDFKFNSVTFNVSSPVNTSETQLNAMLIRMVDTSSTFLIINSDGTISVSKDGWYAISLKQAYEVLDGKADLEMNVYINSAKIEDLNTKVTLSSDFKIRYSTGQVTVRLTTTDKLKVTTKWSTDNISVDNYSSLQITKYLDCREDIDFGTLDSEMYPFVGYARVGHARLLFGITEGEEGGDVDVSVYTLPLVDVARADASILRTLDNSDVS